METNRVAMAQGCGRTQQSNQKVSSTVGDALDHGEQFSATSNGRRRAPEDDVDKSNFAMWEPLGRVDG